VKLLLRVLAWFAIVPYVVVGALVLTGIASWSAVLYVVATGVLLGGLATLPHDAEPFSEPDEKKKKRRPRGISRVGAAAIVIVALLRIFTAGSGRALAVTGSEGGSARFVDRVVDESDLALAGTRALVASGMLHDDSKELTGAMRSAYVRMRAEQGDVPSPVAATYLGLERPSAFDVVVLDPPPGEAVRGAVVFLHGFAGNFDLPCWQIAKAVSGLGVVTACPSTRWVGDWGSAAGAATLERTIAILRSRGIDRVVLAGLSNGGIGASELAPKMKGSFAGLILISGAEPGAPSPGIPTLVLHGKHDTMVEPEEGRAYAAAHGARYVEIDAGHFAMLVRAEQVDREIRSFVGARLGGDLAAE
jgi:hypothetical protein